MAPIIANLGGLLQLRFSCSQAVSDLDQAISELQSAHRLPALVDSDRAAIQHNLGMALALRGDLPAALNAAADAVATYRRLVEVQHSEHAAELAMALRCKSGYFASAGSLELAVQYGREAADLFGGLGDTRAAVGTLDWLGELHENCGDIQRATELYRAAVSAQQGAVRPPERETTAERKKLARATGRNAAGNHDGLLETWLGALADTSFVPGSRRAQARAVLDRSLRQLTSALVAEPFDPTPGYRIGFDLVSARISSPRALGSTMALLGQQLIAQLGIRHQHASARLAALLGQLATGFAEATRNVAISLAEDINRAERIAVGDKHVELRYRLQQALLAERLTGLPNRARLTARLGEILTDPPVCERLGICVINLDRFRAVNDSLGHDKGDWLLRAVARRLHRLTDHPGHFLAHLGADEFAIVLENTTGDDMAKVADLALRTLREPVNLDGHCIPIAASAGIVECAAVRADPTELLRNANIAMRWAKAYDRGHWVSFDQDRYAHELHQHALSAAMPAALRAGQFTLAYQPLIRLADRGLVGVEALARWHHPSHGPIGPAEFIPLAESTGLLVPLGLHLLERACAQAADWYRQAHDPFLVSVNLCAAQLRSPGFTTAVATVVQQTGLPPDRLQLEITENAIADVDKSVQALNVLAQNEVRLAIDDFGAGSSCLTYLADLPIHAVKLDPGFLHNVDEPGRTHLSSTVLPALITLGHDLGLTVTAQGIETAAQARRLAALHCDLGQGFHLGRPTTAENITKLLGQGFVKDDVAPG